MTSRCRNQDVRFAAVASMFVLSMLCLRQTGGVRAGNGNMTGLPQSVRFAAMPVKL